MTILESFFQRKNLWNVENDSEPYLDCAQHRRMILGSSIIIPMGLNALPFTQTDRKTTTKWWIGPGETGETVMTMVKPGYIAVRPKIFQEADREFCEPLDFLG